MANLTTSPPNNQTAAALGALRPDFGASVLKKMHRWRDKGSYADEALILFTALLVVSSTFTLGLGYLLHSEFFSPFLGDFWAKLSAAAFTFFIEGAKITTGLWALWMLLFGLFKRGLPSLAIMILGAALAVGAFMWSYHNSTTGVEKLVSQLATYKTPPSPFDATAATASIDAQISEAQNAQNAALATKWRGTTTVDAMRTAKSIGKRLDELQSQRGLLLHQAMSEHQSRAENRTAFVDGAGYIATTLGGKMEVFQAILLFAIVLCYRTIWEHLKKSDEPASSAQSPAPASLTMFPASNYPANGTTTRRPIGFFQCENQDSPSAPPVEQRQTASDTLFQQVHIADVQRWKNRAKQTMSRSLLTGKSLKYSQDNARRCALYCSLLRLAGYDIDQQDGDLIFIRANRPLPSDFPQQVARLEREISAIRDEQPEHA